MPGRIAHTAAAMLAVSTMGLALRADNIAPPEFCDTQTLGTPERKDRRDEAFMGYLTSGQITLVPTTGEPTLVRNPGELYPTRGQESGEADCQLVTSEVAEFNVRRGYPIIFYTRPNAVIAAAPARSDSGFGVTYKGPDSSGLFDMYEIGGPPPETLNEWGEDVTVLVIDVNQLPESTQATIASAYPDAA